MTGAALHVTCDHGLAQRAADHAPGARIVRPNLVLATTILASSLAFVDGSVVNVGLPAIGRDLAAGGGGLSWIVDGYLLPLSALLLVGGAIGDLYGRRLGLMLGVGLFAIASACCGLAPSLGWLVAGRLVQGAGAALLMPNSLAILGATFKGAERGRAIGTWSSVGAAGGAIAPLLGGWLVDEVGWRAVFAINLPIAAAALWLAWRDVPADQPGEHPPIDATGAGLVVAGLGALTWGLTVASADGVSLATAGALLGGAALLAGFLAVERRRGDRAMMPLSLFGSREFVGLTILTLLLYGALGGVLVLVPFVLIEANGYSATMAGAALLPVPTVIALTSSRMGRLAASVGPRWPLTIGPLVVAAGLLLAVRIGQGGYWATTFPAMLVLAIGLAGAVAPLTTAVLASVTPEHTGIASGLNSAVARTGGLVATALVSVVLAARGPALLPAFHAALIVGAVIASAAGACAFSLVGGRRQT